MKTALYLPTFLTLTCLATSAMAADPPITRNPAVAGDGEQVGVSKRDGITVSGNETFITQNGATEKLVKDLVLPSGIVARPDGTLYLPNGTVVPLRANQMVSLKGQVMDLPVSEGVNANPKPQPANGSTAGAPAGFNTPSNFGAAKSSSPGASDRNQNQGGGGVVSNGNGGFIPGTTSTESTTETSLNDRVFLGPDGRPFMGHFAADGSIMSSDGRTFANNGSIRSVDFDQQGNSSTGTINPDGSVTQSNGNTISRDGTVRTADGRVIGNTRRNARTNGNNSNPNNANSTDSTTTNGTAQQNPPPPQQQTPAGNNRNSPANTGTVNTGNNAGGNSANNTGTVNNPNGNPVTGQPANNTNNNGTQVNGSAGAGTRTGGARATGGARTGGTRNGGSTGGSAGSGTGGTGGASGGGAPK